MTLEGVEFEIAGYARPRRPLHDGLHRLARKGVAGTRARPSADVMAALALDPEAALELVDELLADDAAADDAAPPSPRAPAPAPPPAPPPPPAKNVRVGGETSLYAGRDVPA